MFTELPQAIPQLTDIICAVQGYSSPSVLGLSVQETLGDISQLLQSDIILSFEGNPNGNVAGRAYQLCWDSTDGILYICTAPGVAATAVWSKSITLTGGSGVTIAQSGNIIEISASATGISWNNITVTSAIMATNNAYQANNASLVTFTLPSTASFGDDLWVSGFGAGGWSIQQGANQQIIIGNQSTTLGSGGSLSSTKQNDGVQLYCAVQNLIWKTVSGPQGALNYV